MKYSDMEEIWKNVKGYEEIYEVNNFGMVRNKKTKYILKPQIRGNYLKVSLCLNGKKEQISIHRLVALTFLDNPANFSYVNHKDENKLNNCVDNLEWCSANYNCNYGNRNNKISQNKNKKINQYDLENNFIKKWNSIKEAGENLKISPSLISKVLLKQRKKTHGFIFRYESEV